MQVYTKQEPMKKQNCQLSHVIKNPFIQFIFIEFKFSWSRKMKIKNLKSLSVNYGSFTNNIELLNNILFH